MSSSSINNITYTTNTHNGYPLFVFFLLASATTSTTADHTIVSCSNQTVHEYPTTIITLDMFFTNLVAVSNSTNFYQTIINNTATSVSGLYQCRANLSQTECQTCVKNLTSIIPRPCHTATAKLVDCHMTYEVVQSHVIYSDGGKGYGGCIGASVTSVMVAVVSMLLQS